MSFRVPEVYRVRTGPLGSNAEYGNNGLFQIPLSAHTVAFCIASDGEGWEHISVSIITKRAKKRKRLPNWSEMCKIKSIFWEAEDRVVQYHPPESEYINNAPNVLHLWRPIGQSMPFPPAILVGLKGFNVEQ